MITSRPSADAWAISMKRRCSLSAARCSAISVMPRIPAIGVRISWLIIARNEALARSDAAAASRAAASSRSCRMRSVMSLQVSTRPRT